MLSSTLILKTQDCRSREGAWIEIKFNRSHGLKTTCRSREGAWIEIVLLMPNLLIVGCRSREGAWIEINDSGEQATGNTSVAPARERGLK